MRTSPVDSVTSQPPPGLGTQPVVLSYNAFETASSPVLDLVYALGQMMGDPSFDGTSQVLRSLLANNSNDVARLIGDAGVGKTRLLREFLLLCAAAGDSVVVVGPDPGWAEVGYYALRRAIHELAALPPDGGTVRDWTGAGSEARRGLMDWCLDESWFSAARADCRLMHCLPVRRNVAIADSLLDGPRSVVLRQAYNRMPAQMAVLYRLLKQTE